MSRGRLPLLLGALLLLASCASYTPGGDPARLVTFRGSANERGMWHWERAAIGAVDGRQVGSIYIRRDPKVIKVEPGFRFLTIAAEGVDRTAFHGETWVPLTVQPRTSYTVRCAEAQPGMLVWIEQDHPPRRVSEKIHMKPRGM